MNKTYEHECTKKCKHIDHGQKITLALTKRSIDDNILAAYISKICQNYTDIHDYLGRTALHMGVSVGKYSLSEWLLSQGASINAKDNESGSSPLHRALFYGCINCAVLLIRCGANLDLLDNDTCKPFQNICKMQNLSLNVASYNELLVWGSNKNYNLGIGNNDFAKFPQFIDYFRKENISISDAAISLFHSLFLDKKGFLYSVGSGLKGRLGINSENDLPIPKRVNKLSIKNSDEKIIKVSVSRYHSMILTSKGLVHICGSNESKQLGFKPAPENFLTFKEVPAFQQCNISGILGIAAKDFYSIAYNKNDLYIWGKNLGQCGNIQVNDEILLPKQIQIPDSKDIEYVATNNFAIAVATSGKHIFLYYNFKIKTIKPPVLEDVKSLSLIAPDPHKGKGPTKDDSSPCLQLLLLSDTNVLYIWYEDVQQYLRCSFAHYRLPVVDKIFFKHNQVFLMSQGDVYLGKYNKIPISNLIKESDAAWLSSTQSKKEINSDYKIRIELNRVDGIDRAVDIFCDDNLDSFIALQEHSKKYYVLPKLYAEEYNFKKLYNDVNEFDSIHDLIFHVQDEIFYAHKFIIYSRSKGLKAIIEQFNDKNIFLNYDNFTGKMFELILKYIYCNYFLTLDDITDISQSLGPNFNGKNNHIEIFAEIAKKFLLTDLVLHVKSLFRSTNIKSNTKIFDKTKSRFNRLKRSNFPDLYDVKINCANNQQLNGHKCVLVTRLEYFNLMFTHSWSETTSINLTTLPIEYMEPIIDFLYTGDIDNFKKQNYNETFLYNMIVICDQYFIDRLRKVCEILVLEKVSIRKCGEILEFAESYNCEILKRGCMDFICQNLNRVLYQRSLEVCEPETLKNLNIHYRQIFQNVFDFRHITPDCESINDEELLEFVEDFAVDLDCKIEENVSSAKNIKKNKSREEKFKTDRRNYEKDAISTKLKELHLENQQNILIKENELSNKKLKDILKNASETNDGIISVSSLWTKITDKKEQKQRQKSIAGSPNVNSILKNEEKQKEKYFNLNKCLKSPPTNSTVISQSFDNKTEENKDEIETSFESTNRHSLNFGDFTPSKSDKMSQKQRKRLPSTSSVKMLKTSFNEIINPTKPISIPAEKPNAWGIISSPSNEFNLSSFSNKSQESPEIRKQYMSTPESPVGNSFPIMNPHQKSEKLSTGAISKQKFSYSNLMSTSSPLNQIFEDEKRQKDNFEKMRSKSLVLTQMEEKAISELRDFYNVDNCEDEIITIARKPININYNLPVWQKH